jgi:CRP-like cAMP-binding protein
MGQEHAAVLRSTTFCRMLSAAELETIAALAERRSLAPGGELFHEGESGDGLYVVIFGEIEIVSRTQAGERTLARLGAGEVLGEISLLTSEARSASARALAPTDVLRLPAAGFRALLHEDSPAALKLAAGIAEVLARRLAATNARMLGLVDRLEADRAARAGASDEELAELHRTLRVWSF